MTKEGQLSRVAAARPKALPLANGQTIGKRALAAATRRLWARCAAILSYTLGNNGGRILLAGRIDKLHKKCENFC